MKHLNYYQSLDEVGLKLLEDFEDEAYTEVLSRKMERKGRRDHDLEKSRSKKKRHA